MREIRLGRNVKEYYTSLEDMREAWGLPPVTKKTSDEKKLKGQQEKFVNKHRCKSCGEPMTWVGGNQMTCMNERCKGIKVEREDKKGNKIVSYITSYDLLDDVGAEIASAIFS